MFYFQLATNGYTLKNMHTVTYPLLEDGNLKPLLFLITVLAIVSSSEPVAVMITKVLVSIVTC